MAKPISSTGAFGQTSEGRGSEHYELRLYVAGNTAGSTRAIESLREICEEHLLGRYHLEVVDVYQQPVLARDEQIIAVPTLVKRLPLPIRKMIGDLADKQRVLLGLDLEQKPDEKKRRAPKR